uniref:MALT paracaspase 2 n=1 Tax=Tetraodon nigroviridis TaxID=99883 RepID=H3DDE6_TETNG
TVASLDQGVLNKLALMLDRATRGWRQLAGALSEHPRFRCSENELTSCSLQVLSPSGSPGRALLAVLADRFCSLDFLLQCPGKDRPPCLLVVDIQISVQPQSQQAPAGSRVLLTCRASGPPELKYQWFRGKEEILEETGSTPELVLCPLAKNHQGHYICRVNHGIKCIFSQWAHVNVLHSADCSDSLLPGSASGLLVTCQPQPQAVSEGESLFLECKAQANPPAQYMWHHNMVPMEQEKSHLLQIPCVTTAHRGQYRCKVFNLYHEAWTDAATVTIDDEFETQGHMSGSADLSRCLRLTHSATDKIALLIGNMNYLHHTQLSAPIADVHELTNLLRQMDFKVVSLLDLNWQEMHSAVTEFLLLLDKGVYGLLYFAGHGYENYGNSFMVPIDAPASYTSQHCLCVQSILTRMQEKQTGLNVFLLDMCRKRNPNDDIIVLPGQIKVTANIVFGYATCVDAEAYEVKREDVTNGIFISFLKRRVCEDEKVTVMLDRVAEDMGHLEITRGRQALELRSNLSERRSLTDPIRTPEYCSLSSSARNLQWAVAHVLPQSLCLKFECGVKVQLGFAAEFSNVMVIYTRILEKPKEISSCSAQLTDFPEDVDVHLKKSNQESLLEAGSLIVNEENPSPEVSSLYTRIRSLQRLKAEFTFTTCLHYNYLHMNEEVQERQTVSVGKPLVSKLNLH